MKKHYRKETDCANCGAELQGKFCHTCGQENLELKENFGHMLNHAISDYFHFDHQFFNTLKPLLLNPGKLTNEYMAGKRVRYLHPVKMYIFISLVYFLLLFQSSSTTKSKVTFTDKQESKKSMEEHKRKLDSLAKSPDIPIFAKKMIQKSAEQTEKAINKGDTLKNDNINIDDDSDSKVAVKSKHKRNNVHLFSSFDDQGAQDTTYDQYLARQAKLSPDKQDNFFVRYVKKREFQINGDEKGGKELIMEGVKHNAPKMMFLLLPLFALLLKITFWKNKKFYVEHLIYSFHFHCFLFLFLTLIMLAQMIIPKDWDVTRDLVYWFATLSIMWYIYRSLRVVYHRTSGRTISKMIGLAFSYTMVFSFCMALLVVIVALFD